MAKAKKTEPAPNTVRIGGRVYKLGGVKFSDENLAAFSKISSLEDLSDDEAFTAIVDMAGDFRRMLAESLLKGEGKKKADEALDALELKLNPEGETFQAFMSLIQSIMS